MTRKNKFRCEAWLYRTRVVRFVSVMGSPAIPSSKPPHSYSKGGADGAGPAMVAETYLPSRTKSRMLMVYEGQIMIFHKNIHFVCHQKACLLTWTAFNHNLDSFWVRVFCLSLFRDSGVPIWNWGIGGKWEFTDFGIYFWLILGRFPWQNLIKPLPFDPCVFVALFPDPPPLNKFSILIFVSHSSFRTGGPVRMETRAALLMFQLHEEHPLSTKGVKGLPALRGGRYQYEVSQPSFRGWGQACPMGSKGSRPIQVLSSVCISFVGAPPPEAAFLK